MTQGVSTMNTAVESRRYESMAEIRAANKSLGETWFGRNEMRFFRTRIESGVLRGRYFISTRSVRLMITGLSIQSGSFRGLSPFIELADHLTWLFSDMRQRSKEHGFNEAMAEEMILEAMVRFCRSQNYAFMEDRFRDYVAGLCGPNGGAIKKAI